ncbi:YceI family protein [Sediminibacterium sp.]|uniref:YceI family protein n=1 Tax=Sediminibacterium sp. TaxID=1917865 RepID=UPI0025E72443|nr:YceI family protein [Sediminibacterium sp.]
MKNLKTQSLLLILVLFSGYGYIASCTHEAISPLPAAASNTPVITRGTDVLLPKNVTVGDTTSWKLDKSHSSVMWSTIYVGGAGLLTGRFNQFGMHEVTDAKMLNYATAGQPLLDSSWAFYENEPSKSYFNGYVQMNQSNTGEPGRDAGCNISALGTVAIVPGTQNLTVTNLAKIKTTEIKFDPASNDYIVTLQLTWKGTLASPITKTLVGRLKYIRRNRVQFGSAAAYSVFGLQLKFQFNARDYGITSTSIADKVDIECNMNFNNK